MQRRSLWPLAPLALLSGIVGLPGGVFAARAMANIAYVVAGPDGVFYARCIPDSDTGDAGTTTVYRVRKTGDEAIDRYPWFNPGRLLLAWSPIAGQVALMRLDRELEPSSAGPRAAFGFYLGGRLLKTWTTREQLALGAEFGPTYEVPSGRAGYKVLGARQQGLTNDYVFVIRIGETEHAFDILTGLPWRASRTTS
jgi:hypothetical protein